MENATILEEIKEQFQMKPVDLRTYSPLALAYIGDSIFDVVVKTVMIMRGNCPVNKLHRYTSHYVKAESQSKMVETIAELLTEEEAAVLKRGRNAKSFTTAKNASVSDYRRATGLEALIGYLYLSNQTERLVELIRIGMENL